MCLLFLNGISCRRTGVPLNIKARKDSHGFDNIDDYFPDSGAVITIIIIIIILLLLLLVLFCKVTVHALMYSND